MSIKSTVERLKEVRRSIKQKISPEITEEEANKKSEEIMQAAREIDASNAVLQKALEEVRRAWAETPDGKVSEMLKFVQERLKGWDVEVKDHIRHGDANPDEFFEGHIKPIRETIRQVLTGLNVLKKKYEQQGDDVSEIVKTFEALKESYVKIEKLEPEYVILGLALDDIRSHSLVSPNVQLVVAHERQLLEQLRQRSPKVAKQIIANPAIKHLAYYTKEHETVERILAELESEKAKGRWPFYERLKSRKGRKEVLKEFEHIGDLRFEKELENVLLTKNIIDTITFFKNKAVEFREGRVLDRTEREAQDVLRKIISRRYIELHVRIMDAGVDTVESRLKKHYRHLKGARKKLEKIENKWVTDVALAVKMVDSLQDMQKEIDDLEAQEQHSSLRQNSIRQEDYLANVMQYMMQGGELTPEMLDQISERVNWLKEARDTMVSTDKKTSKIIKLSDVKLAEKKIKDAQESGRKMNQKLDKVMAELGVSRRAA